MAIIGIGNEGIPFGHFHAVKQLARYILNQCFIVVAVGIGRAHIQLEAVTDGAVIQRLLQTRNQKTGAMQVDQRLTAFGAVQHFAAFIGHGIVESNNTQVAHIHGRSPLFNESRPQRTTPGPRKIATSIPEKKGAEHPRRRCAELPSSATRQQTFCLHRHCAAQDPGLPRNGALWARRAPDENKIDE